MSRSEKITGWREAEACGDACWLEGVNKLASRYVKGTNDRIK